MMARPYSWPAEAVATAREMRAEGVSCAEGAAHITATYGRRCFPSRFHSWVRDIDVPQHPRRPRWEPKWKERAAELYREIPLVTRVAAIIEIESKRRCAHVTVAQWLGLYRSGESL